MEVENKNQTPRVGRFFVKRQIDRFRKIYKDGHRLSPEKKHETGEIREGEYFSRHLFESLLSVPNCAGLSILYGAAPEKGDKIVEEGDDHKPRLFIVPVDENGKALPFYLKVDSTGLKDVEEQFEGGGEGKPIPPYGQ